MAESPAAQANKNFNNLIEETRCFKQCLRLENASLQNLLDGNFKEEDVADILKRKPEFTNELRETINMCEECKNLLEKLDIAVFNKREQKGRNNLKDCDSGIGSIVSQDLERQGSEARIIAQDTSAHTYSEVVTSGSGDHSKDDVDDTEC